jgi:hypothetical protein
VLSIRDHIKDPGAHIRTWRATFGLPPCNPSEPGRRPSSCCGFEPTDIGVYRSYPEAAIALFDQSGWDFEVRVQ